ncbi:CWF19-like protein 2 homolog [Euwallacea fornicatus]|uniref:CWF19-like protein 2 homolog n=1 Tax=Euwallacea fornicatus TaxID=995702 RepID=UPI00338DCADC
MGKHSKKPKKHKSNKNKRSHKRESSSEDEWVEAESIQKLKDESSDSSEEIIKKRKSQKSSTSLSSDSEDQQDRRQNSSLITEKNLENARNQRDDWMSLSTKFSSFSNDDFRKRKEDERKRQKELEKYDPKKSSRELNRYWRDGGDGLPKFQKCKDEDPRSFDQNKFNKHTSFSSSLHVSRWRKSVPDDKASKSVNKDCEQITDPLPSTSKEEKYSTSCQPETHAPITPKDLNLLAGKLLKAEIMGNQKLILELKEKLENARKTLNEGEVQEEKVLLTQTTRQGLSKPLELERPRDLEREKRRKHASETHSDQKRVRYFADDDKYSLQKMFENEKFSSGNQQDESFMKIASKLRKNDDLDDFFADSARRTKSDSKIAEETRNKTINEYKKVSTSLDNCSRCIQSGGMQKHLIVSLGEYVYLSVPSHEPLLTGHCLIVPVRHVASVTQLDENEWTEILDFRKALVKLFEAKEQQPIFFEIAVGFHRYPHMVLECVPMNKGDAALAPMFFKKAIDESETEWSQNKKLVSLKGRDVRKVVPKELSYFSVSFGMNEGFAHVIEDEKLFPKNFAQEIIGGILDLDHSLWRKPVRESFDVQSKRVLSFSREWKKYDPTVKN